MAIFPPKPARAEDFSKPVSWLIGRDLIAGLKWIALYAAFKGKLDPRDWMTANRFPHFSEDEKCLEFWRGRNDRNWRWKVAYDKFWAGKNAETPEFWKQNEGTPAEEFWFDYIADSGDGQMATYSVAYLCMSDMWTEDEPRVGSSVSFVEPPVKSKLLPRGQFLFVGGDTTYHIADYTSLSERFQQPFRWAFTSIRNWLRSTGRLTAPASDDEGHIPLLDHQGRVLRSDSEPARPIFGIPGNHDYYDVIDGFNRQFRRPAIKEHTREPERPQLSIPGFDREQNASYMAVHLPFGWWLWGLDTEVSKLDVRQRGFFLDVTKDGPPDKLILATPEPTTVFRECKKDEDKTLEAYEQLGLKKPFEAKSDQHGCRLDLSGDVHHYARYYGPNTKNLPPAAGRSSDHYASLVSGGGGAFLHPSETRISGDDAIEEQVLYPPAETSHAEVAKQLFDLRNIWHGGYVWLFGMIVAGVIYFALTVPQTSKNFLEWLLWDCDDKGNCAGRELFGRQIFVRDSDFLGLPNLNFSQAISLKGFIGSTILLIVSLGLFGVAIYLFSRYIKRLANASFIFDEDTSGKGDKIDLITATVSEDRGTAASNLTSNPKPVMQEADDPPINYRDLWPVWLCVAAAAVLYLVGIVGPAFKAELLHPFGSSLLVLAHVVIAAELLALSTQNSAWLANRPKFETGNKYRYLPVWLLTTLAGYFLFFGIWMFGRYPGAYVLSDTIFALVVIGLLVALIGVGVSVGGALQRWAGKVFMGVMGFWHAVLQLAVPVLLVRLGDWRALGWALVVIFVFSGLSIPYTRISIPGLGVWLMRLRDPLGRVALTLGWVVYGLLLLLLPLRLNDQRGIFTVPRNGDHYSSFLSQGVVTWLQGQFSFSEYAPAWALLIISLITALLFGFLLSMSWLSWYFAVSLAFQGHNNEVGGAARIEKFRHILRVRLTKDGVTTYVIGFDDPAVAGHNLKPKLVDVFSLTVT
jgi:hypothetical protein